MTTYTHLSDEELARLAVTEMSPDLDSDLSLEISKRFAEVIHHNTSYRAMLDALDTTYDIRDADAIHAAMRKAEAYDEAAEAVSQLTTLFNQR